jgi:hypothetical protein
MSKEKSKKIFGGVVFFILPHGCGAIPWAVIVKQSINTLFFED